MSINSAPTPVGLVRKLCLRFFLKPTTGVVRLLVFALSLVFALPKVVLAQSHGAHVHGVAELSVVFEDGILMVELETPAANVLGFEHAPTNARERQALREARELLNAPGRVVTLKPSCEIKEQNIIMPYSDMDHDAVDSTHNSDHSASDDEHEEQDAHAAHRDHEDQEDHEHQEGHGKHEEHRDHQEYKGRADHDNDKAHAQRDHQHGRETHQEFHMVYQWHCSADGPIVMQVKLFEQFPGFEKVKVQWLAFGRQSAEVLDKEHTKVEIGP